MSRQKFRSLKAAKIRADWNKYTLFNLDRNRRANEASRTYFQQKWAAKKATRAYHGEVIREKKWQRMFSKKLPAVVSMDPKYMAKHDGSELAMGRGSGLSSDSRKDNKILDSTTPYMQMTYFPIERRLDMAIWRALFASSVRQARQFVVHGYVKVNGKPFRHPSYLLNPGDMFQVEPDRVMFATGAKKVNNHRTRQRMKSRKVTAFKTRGSKNATKTEQDEGAEAEAAAEESPETTTSESAATQPESENADEEEADTPADTHKRLKAILAAAKEIASSPRTRELSGKTKQEIRAFKKLVSRTLSRSSKTAEHQQVTTINDLVAQMEALKLKMSPAKARNSATANSDNQSTSSTTTTDQNLVISEAEEQDLQQAIQEAIQDAHEEQQAADKSKPYKTPWQPRRYMSPFAFIPRYLEVNQNVCAAVYLRHPVARAGIAEVPTPFNMETSQLAFNWYLRRR
ncbi:alpha-L RNA-binding motif-containing protein [Pseudovirgaria hyperparasitica]|uniref:Small ribosomal subunit protein uS4m n=1 Tax=Pseudovirgaria hyperparasitica TaxID=470096 RepID=A0A6A6WHG1_9PEZI|nr:alpha-L RNA-binding motif-containing protein [Pseudovirgaria hyperparasitica]KAF2762242.1 alpha-L RNA-binding motif-containing protein [Pseudovirgaria hyperparasitica]